jgi:hypothetical protein
MKPSKMTAALTGVIALMLFVALFEVSFKAPYIKLETHPAHERDCTREFWEADESSSLRELARRAVGRRASYHISPEELNWHNHVPSNAFIVDQDRWCKEHHPEWHRHRPYGGFKIRLRGWR